MNDAEKLLAALDKVIAEPAPAMPTFEELARTIIKRSGKSIVSKAEMARLEDYQLQWQRVAEERDKHTRIRAKEDWLRHQQGLRDAIRAGTAGQLDAWNRTDFEQDYFEKLECAKATLRELGAEISPFVREIAERLKRLAEAQAAEVDARAAADFKGYGVPFQTSPLASKLRSVGAQATEIGSRSPKENLPYLF